MVNSREKCKNSRNICVGFWSWHAWCALVIRLDGVLRLDSHCRVCSLRVELESHVELHRSAGPGVPVGFLANRNAPFGSYLDTKITTECNCDTTALNPDQRSKHHAGTYLFRLPITWNPDHLDENFGTYRFILVPVYAFHTSMNQYIPVYDYQCGMYQYVPVYDRILVCTSMY